MNNLSSNKKKVVVNRELKRKLKLEKLAKQLKSNIFKRKNKK
tara:strand:+ start:360 stop:485 length:126 start_codon:yes stop_codon:yes gene_type:complete